MSEAERVAREVVRRLAEVGIRAEAYALPTVCGWVDRGPLLAPEWQVLPALWAVRTRDGRKQVVSEAEARDAAYDIAGEMARRLVEG